MRPPNDPDQARVTILIPTMNRAPFLRRALSYYRAAGFQGAVVVGDSSEGRDRAENQRTVAAVSDRLRVVYCHFPTSRYIHDGACMKEMIDRTPTPFALYAGDDDLAVVSGLGPSVRFLEARPDYAAVHGVRINLRLDDPGATGRVVGALVLPGQESLSDSPAQRWVEYMRTGFSTQYFLHRTETWRRMYREVPDVPSRYLGPEMLPCGLTALMGKVGRLDVLTTVFQVNENQIFSWEKTGLFDLMNQAAWAPSAAVIRRTITGVLIEKAGLGEAEAERLFDQEFGRHVIGILVSQFNGRFGGQERTTRETRETLDQLRSFSSSFRNELAGLVDVFEKAPHLAMPRTEDAPGTGPDPSARYAEILERMERGDWAEAERSLKEALTDGPSEARLYNALGCLLFRTGRIDRALKAFDQAVQLDPQDEDAAFNRHALREEMAGEGAE
jgi:glycosyltransferase domain-containing protein